MKPPPAWRSDMATPHSDDTRKRFNLSRLIYVFVVASVFVYAFVVEMMRGNPDFAGRPGPAPGIDTLRYVLFAFSAAMFFIIRFMRKYLASKIAKDAGDAAAKLTSIDIVTAALCESVAIYGLVLFFVGRRPDDFYALMALSLLYFAIHFPKYSQWEEWAGKARPVAGR